MNKRNFVERMFVYPKGEDDSNKTKGHDWTDAWYTNTDETPPINGLDDNGLEMFHEKGVNYTMIIWKDFVRKREQALKDGLSSHLLEM